MKNILRNRLFVIFLVILASTTILGVILNKRDLGPLKILSPLSRSFSILSFSSKRDPPKKIIYGYLPYWSLAQIKYIQLDKITDIAYFGLQIDENGDFVTRDGDGNTDPGYNQWKKSKDIDDLIADCKKNNVRFSLTIISHIDDNSDKFLDCRDCWDNLFENIKSELLAKNIKDVNLNFEYVETTPKEKALQYTEFTKYLNNRLDNTFDDSKLVVATFADSVVKERVTDIESLGKVADQIFIMAYDFHRPSSDQAGPVAPIKGKGVYAEYDIETMIRDYLSFVPPSKLILGVPYYGYNWVVEKDEKYSKRIPGSEGTGFSQSQTYDAIMETILTIKPEIKWDDLAKTPYFTYISPETGSIREVYFENEQSLQEKYKFAKKHNLAGIGIWALGYDKGYNELWNLLKEEFLD